MSTINQKGERRYVPTTPDFHQKNHRNVWFSIGGAIILISLIIAIILGAWETFS